ncbi:MAG: hypothetical protein ABR497_10540 [Kiritimatiellia bacterium]
MSRPEHLNHKTADWEMVAFIKSWPQAESGVEPPHSKALHKESGVEPPHSKAPHKESGVEPPHSKALQ